MGFSSARRPVNLTEIDPEDPEAELEGPVSVKVNIPFGVNNIYGYLVVPDGTEDLSGLAYAAKMEIVIGSSELGLGGYYRKGQPPAVMLTCTGSVSDLAFFAEGVASYGSDRTFVVPDDDSPGGYTTAAYDDQWFFQATAGAMYIWNDDESDLALTLAAQYLFNGAGYADPSPINTSANAGILAALMACGSLSPSDLLGAGMHYGAALVSLSMTEDLSVSAFWLGDISDRSGLLRLSVSWAASDDINITASLPYTYGTAGAEYSPFGSRLGFASSSAWGAALFEMTGRILIIEDEKELADLMRLYLEREGLEVRCAETAEAGLAVVGVSPCDMVILDINLPGMDGFEFLQRFRKKSDTPVMIVSARESDEDIVTGLGIGADEFVTKPFSPRVLSARVRALLRRGRTPAGGNGRTIRFGEYELDCDGYRLKRAGETVPMPAREFEVLRFLAENGGIAFSVQEIYDRVWNREFGDTIAVSVYIQRIRKKIEKDYRRPEYIRTIHGKGYLFSGEKLP